MPKKKVTNKLPYGDSKPIVIYGIIRLKTKKLVKVHLSHKEIWYEFNTSMFEKSKYSVVKLEIRLG